MNAQNVKVENDNLIVTTSKERITFSTSRENPVTIVNLAMTIADTVGRLLKRPTHEVSEKFDDRFGDLAVEVFPARSRVVLTVDRGGDLQGLVQGAVEIANNLRASVQMRWQDNGEHSFNVRAEDTIRTVNQSVHPPVTGSLLAEVNQSLSRPTYGHVDEPAISFGNITAKVFSDHQRVLVENAQGDDINALLSNMVEIANFTGLTVQGSSHHGRYLYTAKYRDTILDVKMREAHAAMGAQSMAIPVAEHQADFGGIDFNAANLNLQIKRDGKGMPLPMTQQNWMNIRIDGLIPIIIDIRPASSLPVFLELQNSVKVVNG